jgi:hypothetical protein
MNTTEVLTYSEQAADRLLFRDSPNHTFLICSILELAKIVKMVCGSREDHAMQKRYTEGPSQLTVPFC